MWKTIIIVTCILFCLSGLTMGSGPDLNAQHVAGNESDQREGPDWQDLVSAQQLAADQDKTIMIFFEAERMASLLAFIASDSFGRQSFEEFQERH